METVTHTISTAIISNFWFNISSFKKYPEILDLSDKKGIDVQGLKWCMWDKKET